MGRPIRLKDGTVVLAEMKPGAVLTKEEEEILAEYVQFVRDRSDKARLRCPVCTPNPKAKSMPVKDLCPKHKREYQKALATNAEVGA